MPYKAEADKLLLKIAEFDSAKEGEKIEVAVFSYNNGEPRIGMRRVGTKRDGNPYYGKLGRLSGQEMVRLTSALSTFEGELKDAGILSPKGTFKPKRFGKWLGKHAIKAEKKKVPVRAVPKKGKKKLPTR